MPRGRLSWYTAVLHIFLIALVAEVLFLVGENRDLRTTQSVDLPPRLEAGDVLEPVPVVDLRGQASNLDFVGSGVESVLMVFTTQCPYCAENQGAWRELYSRFKGRYRVIGIAVGDVDSVRSYAETHSLEYPILVPSDPRGFTEAYKIPGVPTTVFVGSDGRVKTVWNGLLDDDSYGALEVA